MLFNSFTFLVFFAIVLLIHRVSFSWTQKKIHLLLASYLFYAAWNPPFVVLLWISTAVDWLVGRRLHASDDAGTRKRLVAVSLAVNLGLLGYFKYAGFVLENFVWLVQQLGFDYNPAAPDIILPLGISFYTFQTLSYTLSIYRRDGEPADSLVDFALFVTFFPQLVAGPIVRATDFIVQLATPKQADAQQLGWGLAMMNFGIFQKVVLADTLLAPVADKVFGFPRIAGTVDAWIGSLAFSGQIFFDFGGYSSCAIGAALCLGFVLPENFRCPYASLGFSDFWRRWHISLSTWLRDYLYISMGGNRAGAVRTYINLAATMLLGGLWHGASWTFVVWGGLHGFYLIVERALKAQFGGVALFHTAAFKILSYGSTFVVVTLTWVFFRAETVAQATTLLATMFADVPRRELSSGQVNTVLVVVGVMLIAQLSLRNTDLERAFSRLPTLVKGPLLALPILCLFAVPGDNRAFIYFQF
jgi:alginate O-acetyltransferase complex protein AlgI